MELYNLLLIHAVIFFFLGMIVILTYEGKKFVKTSWTLLMLAFGLLEAAIWVAYLGG